MEISDELYFWLKEANVLLADNHSQTESGKFMLDQETSRALENGLNFTSLIKRLNQIQNKLERLTTPMPEINSLKQVTNASTKLYNWKVLCQALEMLKVTVDPDTRALIVAGDRDMVVEVLQQIYDAENKAKAQIFEEIDAPRMGSAGGDKQNEEKKVDELILDQSIHEIDEVKINESAKFKRESLKNSFDSKKSEKIIRSSVRSSTKNSQSMKRDEKLPDIKNSRAESKAPKPKKARAGPDGALFIESIDAERALDKSETCLEFLLTSFCKHFQLKPKQAAGLLTQGGKYLAHVIAKGLRGKHNPIVTWYQSIYANIRHLVKLIAQEEANGSINLILSSLKSGFISKHIETALWCCRLFAKLGSDFLEYDMLPAAWDWFVSDGGGIEGCLLACKRYGPDIKSQVVSVFVQFARNHFLELFSLQLRSQIPESIHYLTTMNEFLPSLCEIRAAKQEIVTAGIVDFWMEFGLREADADNRRPPDVRLAALNFVCDIWIYLPTTIELHEEFASSILTSIKRGARDKYRILKFGCLGKLFHLLDAFTAERNPYAPIIYKTLTFSLVENYDDPLVREFILANFISTFVNIQSIPVGIVVEPLVKQLQVSPDLSFNTVDFDFLITIAKHPRLTVKHAIQVMDILGKIYINEPLFSKSAAIPFMLAASRFIDNTPVQEYLFRFTKFGMKLVSRVAKKKPKQKPKEKKEEEKEESKESDEVVDKDLKSIQQKNAMLDMIQRVIKLRNDSLNDRIKQEMLETNKEIKTQTGENSKGILAVLRLLGEPDALVDNFDFQEKQKAEEEQAKVAVQAAEQEVAEKPVEPRRKRNKEKPMQRYRSNSSFTSENSIQPRGRVMYDIEKVRQLRIEKEVERRVQEEKEKLKLAKRKRALKRQVEKRRIELGVASKVPQEAEVITEVSKIEENNNVLRELTLDEQENINIILKRYARVLKLLFRKYSSTGYTKKKVGKETFDTAAEKSVSLYEGEFYKLLKEQGVTSSMMSLDEFGLLMKTYCHNRQRKSEIKVDFNEYQELIVQAALFIYSRPPKDLSHYAPVVSVKTLFDHFRRSSSDKGVSTRFYDEPDPGVGDRDVIKRLNVLLQKDPNTPLPDGYKRVTEKDVEIVYEVPEALQLPESKNVVLGLMDDLISGLFGTHILEPQIKYKTVVRAKGVLARPQLYPVEDNTSMITSSKANLSYMGMSSFKAAYQAPALPFELILTPGIKYEVARLSGRYPNDIINECAKLLDDLIYTTDLGAFQLVSRNEKPKIKNTAMIQKEVAIQQKEMESKERERKRRLRKQIIEEKLLKAKEEKEKKQKEEEEKKKQEEEQKALRRQKQRAKRELEKSRREVEINEWKKKRNEVSQQRKEEETKKKQEEEIMSKKKREAILSEKRMEEIKQWKIKKEEENKKKEEEENKLKEQEEEKKRKQRERFLKKEKEKLENNLKEQLSKKETMAKQEEEKRRQEEAKMAEKRKKLTERLLKNKSKREQEKKRPKDESASEN
ncbi:unnamed protein product [Blepharisma stoltei]|uniref:Uncharacterized protein n=1 Tax=Blepharisma stoltei TaxID=1481888 RepID=A0AAU9IIT2_9CILI|nr:unnamed protein product [Blepharisma stoltei]